MRQWLVPAMVELGKLGIFVAAGAALLLGVLLVR